MYIRGVKMVAIILSVYILALNFAPCNDVPETDNTNQTQIVQQLTVDHSTNHSDLCSPFCQCSCCQVLTLDFPITNFEPLLISFSSEEIFFPEKSAHTFIQTILQPPRV